MFHNSTTINQNNNSYPIMIERHYMTEDTYRHLYFPNSIYNNLQIPLWTPSYQPMPPTSIYSQMPQPSLIPTPPPSPSPPLPPRSNQRMRLLDFIFNLVPTNTNNEENTPPPLSITPQQLNNNTTLELFNATTSARRNITMCSICYDEFENNPIVRTLNHCEHSFHYTCFDRWISNNTNCPVCRSNIINEPLPPPTTTNPPPPPPPQTFQRNRNSQSDNNVISTSFSLFNSPDSII